MQPIWSLSKPRMNTDEWNPTLRGGLGSTLAGRQWTQARVMAAGWASHNNCLACLQTIAENEETGWQRSVRVELHEAEGKDAKLQVAATQQAAATQAAAARHAALPPDLRLE